MKTETELGVYKPRDTKDGQCPQALRILPQSLGKRTNPPTP